MMGSIRGLEESYEFYDSMQRIVMDTGISRVACCEL